MDRVWSHYSGSTGTEDRVLAVVVGISTTDACPREYVTDDAPEPVAAAHWLHNPLEPAVSIYEDEDGGFVARCPSIPGCISQGETRDEARANIRSAIRECLEVRAELGLPLTVDTRETEAAD